MQLKTHKYLHYIALKQRDILTNEYRNGVLMEVLIDGQQYIPQPEHKDYSIGIGITTHNRNRLVASTVARLLEVTPNAKVVVVDDASSERVKLEGVEVYRFRTNVGIARAKNKCLELLSDCDHIFLFDDDTYPLVEGWTEPYINSPEHHLMYLFKTWSDGSNVDGDQIVYQDEHIEAHSNARGCMLYVDRLVLDTVGGMDTGYGKAMHEHLEWTNRIHNAGLTTFKNMDVPGSSRLIYSMDEHREVASSIARADRVANLKRNTERYERSLTSTTFMPYGKDVVIACYFANVMDVQRGKAWQPDQKAIAKLKASVELHGYEFVLIHNCFDLPNKVSISTTPYFERWLKEWQYLRDRRDIGNVFVVDATDVDMINNPFPHIEPGKLYIGDEPEHTLANPWMTRMHQEPNVNSWLRENSTLPLLNCGVVGGERRLVMAVCRDMYQYHFEYPQDQTEMGIFNRLMHTKYADVIEYGRRVTTLFKKYERRSNAWFRHK